MNGYTVLWIAWLLMFAGLEGTALARKDTGDTLSEHAWRWFRVRDPRPTPLVWLLRVPLLAGGIWLTGHLAFGWWTL